MALNKKILIYPTIEVEEYSEITDKFNSNPVKNCIFICMESMPDIKETIVSNVLASKNYSQDFKSSILKWDLNKAIDEFLLMEDPEKVLNEVFSGTYDKLLKQIAVNLEKTNGVHDILFSLPFYYPKPVDFYTIGWVVPKASGDHLSEHERVEFDIAEKFIEHYNNYLRSNELFFDKFFDGNSIEEVLDFIKNLE